MEDMKKIKEIELDEAEARKIEAKHSLIDKLQDKMEDVLFEASELELIEDDIYSELFDDDPSMEVVKAMTEAQKKIKENIGGWCSMIIEAMIEDPEELKEKIEDYCNAYEDYDRLEYAKNHFSY